MKKKILLVITVILTIGLTIYCMVNQMGLVEGLDFGACAYYYADIPEFSKYVDVNHFTSNFPMWIHILLFLGWGYIMFRLWIWIDKKIK